jgi:putative ABC transport system substrate-binding protein
MKRRDFIALLGSAGLARLRTTRAAAQQQQSAHVGFISALDQSAAADFISALREGLASHGYTEPHTLRIDQVFANFELARIPSLAAQLERERVDVIVTHAGATDAVVKGAHAVPVVYEFSADPVNLGIAKDLAHPLYNATGITLMAVEMNGKRLELLHEIAPHIRRVAVIANPLHPGAQLEQADFSAEARQLGIDVAFYLTPNREELDRALAAIDRDLPEALALFADAFVVDNRHYIVNYAMSRRLPVVSGWAVMAESGAVCTYGPRLVESYRRTAYFVDRILKGAKPADLPIEQPTVLELVVNLNAAKLLGLAIPPSVLVRADRVIE